MVESSAQKDFGRSMIDELCSEKYDGRGYVNDGHLKAAKFIANQFSSMGLIPVGNDFFQPFKMDVNTFPGAVSLQVEDESLQPGEDFIIDAVSGTAIGTYHPVWIRSDDDFFKFEFGSESREGKVLIIKDIDTKDIDTNQMLRDWKYKGANLAPVIFLTDKKFTWTVGRMSFKFPIIELRDSLFSSNFKDSSVTVNMDIENQFVKQLESNNVIAKVQGKKNKTIVLSAHYDHLGRMGKDTYFPGANDNASGVAMLLYLAKYYSTHKPRYNMVFMAFGGEEVGLLGSREYVQHPLFPLEEIKFLINLDILGTGDEGITVVNGAVYPKQFKKLSKINSKEEYLKKVKIRGKAANSDHYFFSEAGVPSFFIYTMGGVSHYHDVYDKSDTLPLDKFNELSELIIKFIAAL